MALLSGGLPTVHIASTRFPETDFNVMFDFCSSCKRVTSIVLHKQCCFELLSQAPGKIKNKFLI